MDDAVVKRIIIALVSVILRQAKRLNEQERDRLDKFKKVESNMFSENESVEFYCGKGLQVFDEFLIEQLLKSPRKLRSEQMYRTVLDGDAEQDDLINRAVKKLGRKG